jgi:hypothetical protein
MLPPILRCGTDDDAKMLEAVIAFMRSGHAYGAGMLIVLTDEHKASLEAMCDASSISLAKKDVTLVSCNDVTVALLDAVRNAADSGACTQETALLANQKFIFEEQVFRSIFEPHIAELGIARRPVRVFGEVSRDRGGRGRMRGDAR